MIITSHLDPGGVHCPTTTLTATIKPRQLGRPDSTERWKRGTSCNPASQTPCLSTSLGIRHIRVCLFFRLRPAWGAPYRHVRVLPTRMYGCV